MMPQSKHLLGLEGMNAREITHLLDLAGSFEEILERPVKKVPTLRGRTIVNAFFESSTRTRVSFELAQKALVAGMPLLAAVSAPSSLAVSLAREFNLTLVGFLRDDTFNIYAGQERITA